MACHVVLIGAIELEAICGAFGSPVFDHGMDDEGVVNVNPKSELLVSRQRENVDLYRLPFVENT